jgi:hypothetical protein
MGTKGFDPWLQTGAFDLMQGPAKRSIISMENSTWILPSTYNVGHEVCLQFGEDSPIIKHCHVTKVIFTREKVMYDLQVAIYATGQTDDGIQSTCIGHTRIHSVDSAFVYPHNHDHVRWSPRTEYPDTPRKVRCRFTYEGQEFEFRGHVKPDFGGLEWFYDNGDPIRDAVQFEWTEIK